MPIIRCISRYSSALGSWKPEDTEHVTEEMAALLMRDSPGSWELVGEPKAAKRPRSRRAAPRVQERDEATPPTGRETAPAALPGGEFLPEPEENEEDGDVDLEALTVEELREYAAARGVELGTARRKVDLVIAIERAEGAAPGGTAGDEGESDSADDDEGD